MSVRPSERRARGDAVEAAVAAMVERSGYTILERNWNTRGGELDLVAEKGEWLVFAEVRSRRSEAFGSPAESIGFAKQQRIVRAAAKWAARAGLLDSRAIRFDVFSVLVRAEGELEIDWIEAAFDAEGILF
jgi:putative endonuclease